MLQRRDQQLLLLLVLAAEICNGVKRSKKEDHVSTSSETDINRDNTVHSTDDSLEMSISEIHSNGREEHHPILSSKERTGWRKWHRKCTPCPKDEAKVWTDPSVQWICGQYQRARRTFKSLCSMRLRNCQDGTMFVFMKNGRCPNDTTRGQHFFYDYQARRSTDTTSSSSVSDESSSQDISISTDSLERARLLL